MESPSQKRIPRNGRPWAALQIEAERARGSEAIGHDALAAGLIDGRHAAIGKRDIQAAAARGESGGESGRAAANDEEIGRAW